jgi:hypothetical protein
VHFPRSKEEQAEKSIRDFGNQNVLRVEAGEEEMRAGSLPTEKVGVGVLRGKSERLRHEYLSSSDGMSRYIGAATTRS